MREVMVEDNKLDLKVYVNDDFNLSLLPDNILKLFISNLSVQFTNNFKKRRQKKTKVEPP